MIQAIFYKEWIKTRWYLLLATLFMIGITGYSMLRVSRVIAMQGIDHLWVVMVQKDAIFVDLLQYVPLLTGILLAAVQFFPEMQRKCLKLTLHLPYSQKKMILAILAFGLLALAACFATGFIIMGILAWICLEPTWKRRVLNLIIAALICRIYFLAPAPEAYNSFLLVLTLYTLLIASLSWISVVRFKAGKQD